MFCFFYVRGQRIKRVSSYIRLKITAGYLNVDSSVGKKKFNEEQGAGKDYEMNRKF